MDGFNHDGFNHLALKEDVEKLGIPIVELADLSGVSTKTISAILNHGKGSVPTRRKVANAVPNDKTYEDYCEGPRPHRVLLKNEFTYQELVFNGFHSPEFIKKDFTEKQKKNLIDTVRLFFEGLYRSELDNLCLSNNKKRAILKDLLRDDDLSCLHTILKHTKRIYLGARFGMELEALKGTVLCRFSDEPEIQKIYQDLRTRQNAALKSFKKHLRELKVAVDGRNIKKIEHWIRECLNADRAFHMAIDAVGQRIADLFCNGVDLFHHEGATAALRLRIVSEKGTDTTQSKYKPEIILNDFYIDLGDLAAALDAVQSPEDDEGLNKVEDILLRHRDHTEKLLELNDFSAGLLAAQNVGDFDI